MNFIEKLASIVRQNKSLVCVGLDPDPHVEVDDALDTDQDAFHKPRSIAGGVRRCCRETPRR